MIRPRTLLVALAVIVPGALSGQQAPDPTPTPTMAPQRGRPAASELKSADAPAGSSLADAVRKSREARGEAPRRSLGVITNESLKSSSAAPDPTPKGTKAKPGAMPTRPASVPVPVVPIPEPRDNKGRDEATWKTMAASARQRVKVAEVDVQRLEVETKRLENDFYAWSDGNYRDRVIRPSWDQAKEDLKRARLEVDQARAALADLEDEARKSGAPPGWLRDSREGRPNAPTPKPTEKELD